MEMELGKLFIGGISWDTNEDRLREYFQTFGEVVEAVIMKDRATGRARGFGFVVFADAAVAEGVVMEKHIIDGRTVEAKKAVPKNDQHILSKSTISIHGSPGPLRTKKIFVGGLASTVTESEFKKYFDHFGTITDVVVMYDHNTQRPRGFGFITYDSEEAVEKVLVKTFHELNGKMVEVKRAVPKELSPSLNRAQLGGYNCGLGVSNFLSGHSQGYNPASVGSYGLRMDSRFCPITVGRSGVSPFGSAGYGMGLNFEVGLSPSYGGSAGSTPNLSSVRASNSYYNGNSNRYSSPIGFSTGIGGTGSILSPTRRNMWGNGNLNLSSSANSSAFMSSGSGSLGTSSLGSIGAIWSSPVSGQGGRINSAYSSGNISYSNMNFELGGGRYGRSGRASGAPASSYAASTVGYDGAYGNFDEVGSIYGDSTWQSSSSELEMSRSFGQGFGNAASEVAAKNAASYIGGYGVTNRQANSGIAA